MTEYGVRAGGTLEDSVLSAHVRLLAQRVQTLRGRAAEPDADFLEALTALETAHEELRVADEELTAQQSELNELVGLVADERDRRERFAASLPLPVLLTDTAGAIQSCNAAGARLLGLTPRHLTGKPLAAYVEVSDRAKLRTLLSHLSQHGSENEAVVALRPRRPAGAESDDLPSPHVSLHGIPDGLPDGRPGVRWVIGTHAGSPALHGRSSADAIVSLLHVAGTAESLRDALEAAIPIVAQHLDASVSLTIGRWDDPVLQLWDGPLAQSGDAAQYHAAEGPCLEAWVTATVCVTADADHDERWPSLHPVGDSGSIGAVVGAPLVVAGEAVGVLNSYLGAAAYSLDRVAGEAKLIADALAALVHEFSRRDELSSLNTQLNEALLSRATIDHAIGIIMARLGVDAETAFRQLAQHSQNSNTKLRDVADALVRATAKGDGGGP